MGKASENVKNVGRNVKTNVKNAKDNVKTNVISAKDKIVKKKPKKLINIIFSQRTTIILALLIQFIFIFVTFQTLYNEYPYLHVAFATIAVVLAVYILNTNENPAYKLAWIIPLIALPVFTTVLYLILKNQYSTRKVRKTYAKRWETARAYLKTDRTLMQDIWDYSPQRYKLASYVDNYGGFPACANTRVTYFPSGEDKFEAMIRELKKAERFIFMEYFIIDNGEMWQEILEILLDKVSKGVEIRLIYDGMGSQFFLPFMYKQKLIEKGIKCMVFNRFRPFLSSIQNNRDHRKILVIDGKVAFNGGINIADEYINRVDRFGHWKDTAVMLEGDGVWNFTVMFLHMWDVISGTDDNYERYRVSCPRYDAKGFVIPYGDSPLDTENVGELVYMDMINNAKEYVYISTPYLIPDNEMLTVLDFAAKSGVDVRIITPEIPDKKYVSCITRSYHKDLLAMGVKVYEYKGGFNHAKQCLCDGRSAVVGTINFDYRSFYLHFECATYMHDTECIKVIKSDFDDMFENKCRQITAEDVNSRSPIEKFMAVILRTIAPLL
ncbi:MAG: cardiolipin synthase [Ruminococcus sp.]|nr:cardiolipin synthase [Ruminococcus sp.]MBQ7070445.1 cardiolipin synthase [Ruminococcus sp.]